MTREEAKTAINEGKKVTHCYFTMDEYVYLKDGNYWFEDGVHCSPKSFWELRNGSHFNDGWEIYETTADLNPIIILQKEIENLKHDNFFLGNQVIALKKENEMLEKATSRAQDHAENLLKQLEAAKADLIFIRQNPNT